MSQQPLKLASKTISAAAILFAAALALTFVGTPSTYAHAGYDHSTPADGEVLAESPPSVEMFTSQEMARQGGLPVLIVVNDAGDTLSTNTTLDDDDRTHVSAELPADMAPGRYTVIWHTISDEDGEEAEGAFHFYVGEGPETTPPPSAAPGSLTPAPSATTAQGDRADDGDSGVSVVVLIIGIIAGVVVGAGVGIVIGRRASA